MLDSKKSGLGTIRMVILVRCCQRRQKSRQSIDAILKKR